MWKLTGKGVYKLYINDWIDCETKYWKVIATHELDKTIEEFNQKYSNPRYELEIQEVMELDYED